MARPIKEGMDYFPHDTDASSDEKLEALRIIHGNDGYAFYFIMLERIYRTADFELDISDAETRQILARKVEVTIQKFDDMVKTAIKHQCFDPFAYADRGVLTSKGVKKRAASVVEKRNKMALAYQNRVSAAETTPETPQSKVKESKVKESKVKESNIEEADAPVEKTLDEKEKTKKGFTPPSLDEVINEFFLKTGNGRIEAEKFYNFYESKNWMVGKSKMQKWKASAANWISDNRGKMNLEHSAKTPPPNKSQQQSLSDLLAPSPNGRNH